MIPTDYFIIALLALIFFYDVYVLNDKKPNNTISHRVYLFCKTYPLPADIWWPWPQPIFEEVK